MRRRSMQDKMQRNAGTCLHRLQLPVKVRRGVERLWTRLKGLETKMMCGAMNLNEHDETTPQRPQPHTKQRTSTSCRFVIMSPWT